MRNKGASNSKLTQTREFSGLGKSGSEEVVFELRVVQGLRELSGQWERALAFSYLQPFFSSLFIKPF